MTIRNPFHGSWRITSMELWAPDAMDMEVPAFIEFTPDGMGRFQFIMVQGRLDCRYEISAERAVVRFTWEGSDDMDEAHGRGWARLTRSGGLRGRIFFHLGDDSSFKAARVSTALRPAPRATRR
jgi:hypothetical protein